eukprot:3749330-Amphidinium_carterae.1
MLLGGARSLWGARWWMGESERVPYEPGACVSARLAPSGNHVPSCQVWVKLAMAAGSRAFLTSSEVRG